MPGCPDARDLRWIGSHYPDCQAVAAPTMRIMGATAQRPRNNTSSNTYDNTCSNASANRIRLGHSAPAVHQGQEAPHEQQ
ncbi:hypothetical protein ACJJIG_22060 [Microbulbifer sp. SSSA007]|uniref:hypothetical protein n=1 Tax=Microbulbifer sp. SSSA007 TaxID=3243379 RepID=UPI004039AB30